MIFFKIDASPGTINEKNLKSVLNPTLCIRVNLATGVIIKRMIQNCIYLSTSTLAGTLLVHTYLDSCSFLRCWKGQLPVFFKNLSTRQWCLAGILLNGSFAHMVGIAIGSLFLSEI